MCGRERWQRSDFLLWFHKRCDCLRGRRRSFSQKKERKKKKSAQYIDFLVFLLLPRRKIKVGRKGKRGMGFGLGWTTSGRPRKEDGHTREKSPPPKKVFFLSATELGLASLGGKEGGGRRCKEGGRFFWVVTGRSAGGAVFFLGGGGCHGGDAVFFPLLHFTFVVSFRFLVVKSVGRDITQTELQYYSRGILSLWESGQFPSIHPDRGPNEWGKNFIPLKKWGEEETARKCLCRYIRIGGGERGGGGGYLPFPFPGEIPPFRMCRGL